MRTFAFYLIAAAIFIGLGAVAGGLEDVAHAYMQLAFQIAR